MIDLYYWPTPNAHKVTILLEECGLDYVLKPVNILQGQQFDPAFLAIAPNNRMPAITDHAPADGGAPLSLFESGAILEYLADKTGRFLPSQPRPRADVLQWLHWQMSGVGPMFGQAFHFLRMAPEPIDYARKRYLREGERLLGVLDDQLSARDFVAGDYSIADMAIYPWIVTAAKLDIPMDEYGHLMRWQSRIAERPAVTRAYARAADVPRVETSPEETRRNLFEQGRVRKP